MIVKEYADGREDVVRKIEASEWTSANINGVAHYVVAFDGISAKEMTDNVYVTVYDAEGTAVSDTWTDTVRGYAQRTLSNPATTAEELTLATDLLNYGAEAQKYFSYNLDNLANEGIDQTLASEEKACTDNRINGDYLIGSRLILESNIILDFAFAKGTGATKAVVTFANHRNAAQSIEIAASEFGSNNGYPVISVDDLVVADGRMVVTCTLYNGEEVIGEAKDSIESYVARDGSELSKALMKFSDSAYAFFH